MRYTKLFATSLVTLAAAAVLASCSLGAMMKSSHPAARAVTASGVPLDYVTGGGWFTIQSGAVATTAGNRAIFGWHGGVKNGTWWGDGVYIDQGIGLQVNVLSVTGYAISGSDGTDSTGHATGVREIYGTANTNLAGAFQFIVRMQDSGEPGTSDQFAIVLEDSSGNIKYRAQGTLGSTSAGGGNIQIHRGNASSTAPSTAPSGPSNNPF